MVEEKKTIPPPESRYEADQIKVLEGMEAVRQRPGMFIGDTGARGLHHLIYEVVDNSVDESMAGFCTSIHVRIQADGSVVVNEKGEIVMLNQQAEQMLGTTLSLTKGKHVQTLSKQEVVIALAKEIGQNLAIETTGATVIQSSENTKETIKNSTAVVQNPEGKIVGIIAMLNDIAKQKERVYPSV